ncbi:hypothetical protein FRC18_010984 [Serendipita sp. 400]|nr:hypothetical protein FRC18_010984 [Serendipita sp. 400]
MALIQVPDCPTTSKRVLIARVIIASYNPFRGKQIGARTYSAGYASVLGIRRIPVTGVVPLSNSCS